MFAPNKKLVNIGISVYGVMIRIVPNRCKTNIIIDYNSLWSTRFLTSIIL